MNKTRNIWIGLLAAFLSAFVVYGIYELQKMNVARQDTVAVVVPKRFISAGELLQTKDLEVRRLPSSAVDGDMLRELAEAQGKETVIPLGRGEPILKWKLDYYRLQPRRSESTFQIPKDYIRSISNGIRAGDKVLLYASGEGEPSGRLFEEAVVVASVKSSGNQEIDNVDNPHLLSLTEGNMEGMYASRRDANAMIDYLNLNLTEEQWLKLDTLCKSGSLKLVVAYSPESFESIREGESEQ